MCVCWKRFSLDMKSYGFPQLPGKTKELFSATGPYWRIQFSRNLLIISPEAWNRSNFLYPVFICEQKIVDKYQKESIVTTILVWGLSPIWMLRCLSG